MADYVFINNYSSLGKLGFSRKVISEIIGDAVENVSGAKVNSDKKKFIFSLADPVSFSFAKDGKVKVWVDVVLPLGSEVKKTCLAIQKEIAANLSMSLDTVPYEIHVKVAKLA